MTTIKHIEPILSATYALSNVVSKLKITVPGEGFTKYNQSISGSELPDCSVILQGNAIYTSAIKFNTSAIANGTFANAFKRFTCCKNESANTNYHSATEKNTCAIANDDFAIDFNHSACSKNDFSITNYGFAIGENDFDHANHKSDCAQNGFVSIIQQTFLQNLKTQ